MIPLAGQLSNFCAQVVITAIDLKALPKLDAMKGKRAESAPHSMVLANMPVRY